ncbi:MAG TPA: TRAP transporter small permease subunit [Paracoccaceae bacterium]|nr:TRAP transporter small permease subunit [Paracoccaceae bacterium]
MTPARAVPPHPALARAEAWAGRFTAALNVVGTLLIVAVAVLVNADVIGRAALSAPISGVPEMVSLSIVCIVFLQAAEAARQGRFIRSDALLLRLAARAPRAAAALEALWCGLALWLVAVIGTTTWPLMLRAWERGTFVGAVGDFTAPVWPVKAIIVTGCAALALQFALGMLRALLGLTRRGAR